MLAIIAQPEVRKSLEKPFQRHEVSPTMPPTMAAR
jgi:hypothetical protein